MENEPTIQRTCVRCGEPVYFGIIGHEVCPNEKDDPNLAFTDRPWYEGDPVNEVEVSVPLSALIAVRDSWASGDLASAVNALTAYIPESEDNNAE